MSNFDTSVKECNYVTKVRYDGDVAEGGHTDKYYFLACGCDQVWRQ